MQRLKIDLELDCRNTSCPIPVLKTKKSIDTMEIGQILKVHATDPSACEDIQDWVDALGHEMIENGEDTGTYYFVIRKASYSNST